MTLAITRRWRRERRRSCVPRPATPARRPPRTRRRPGSTCAVLVPKGKVAMGKMAQTLVHGARVLEVDGNFDASLELASDWADSLPITLVNKREPVPAPGTEDGGVRDLRRARAGAGPHCVPVGNAGNISSHWLRLLGVPRRRRDP